MKALSEQKINIENKIQNVVLGLRKQSKTEKWKGERT